MKPWVDYELVKRSVGMGGVLQRYGIRLKASGTELRGECPLPQHGTEKHKSHQSFMVNLQKGMGGAWACESTPCVAARGGRKGGNCIDFVQWMERLATIQEAALAIQEWSGLNPTPPSNRGKPVEPKAPVSTAVQVNAPELASKNIEPAQLLESNQPLKFGALKSIDPTHPYLAERGITEETARTFGVGYFPGRGIMTRRVVIPIENLAGELVAYAGRTLEEGAADKYKFPPGFHKSLELFNAHRLFKHTWLDHREDLVIVVEGFFDCMKLWQAGYPAVASMGSSLSDAQAEIIRTHWFEAVLLFDGDDAGRKCTDHALAKLGRHMWVRAALLDEGVQPDQLAPAQIQEIIDSVL